MTSLATDRNVVLIGLMGAGKSTVGRVLAERLRRPLVDTDAVVEAAAGRTVAAIFDAEGETGFRRRESVAVAAVAAVRGQVVAVGGGAVCDPTNVTALRATGVLVHLDAAAAVLAARIGDAAGRPLLAGDEALEQRLARLRAERADAYRRARHCLVDTTDRTASEIAEAVLAAISGPPRQSAP